MKELLMNVFCKTLNPKEDYPLIEQEKGLYHEIKNLLDDCRNPLQEHEHRAWEYGIGLKIIKKERIFSVLDVGGENSTFPFCCAYLGCDTTIVDPQNLGMQIQSQNVRLPDKNCYVKYIQSDFLDFDIDKVYDMVSCISVLEHVRNDTIFFEKLLQYVKPDGILYITFDYHPSGKKFYNDDSHLRTYNIKNIKNFIEIARNKAFEVYGEFADYTYHGNHVFDYNFASIVLQKEKA